MNQWGRFQTFVLLFAPAVAWGVDASEAEVIEQGLYNPRHVVVNEGGTVFVAEAGRGGFRQGNLTASVMGGPVCFGLTSRISAIDGEERRVVARLPSWTPRPANGMCPGAGDDAIGAAGVAVDDDGTVAFTVGFAGHPDDRDALVEALPRAALFGTAFNFYEATYPALLADLLEFERNDPDEMGIDSNPFGLAIDDDGVTRLVADAGANALVRVDPLLGPELVAVFAPQCVAWTEDQPNPLSDG